MQLWDVFKPVESLSTQAGVDPAFSPRSEKGQFTPLEPLTYIDNLPLQARIMMGVD